MSEDTTPEEAPAKPKPKAKAKKAPAKKRKSTARPVNKISDVVVRVTLKSPAQARRLTEVLEATNSRAFTVASVTSPTKTTLEVTGGYEVPKGTVGPSHVLRSIRGAAVRAQATISKIERMG